MIRYLISDTWLISPTARNVYRGCAWISFLLWPALWLMLSFPENTQRPNVAASVMHLLFLLSVTATAVIMVAMEYFLFTKDESAWWKQILWFLALIVLGIGPGLYVLLGYSRSGAFDKARAASAGAS